MNEEPKRNFLTNSFLQESAQYARDAAIADLSCFARMR